MQERIPPDIQPLPVIGAVIHALRPPLFEDEELFGQALVAHVVALIGIVASAIMLVATLVRGQDYPYPPTLMAIIALGLVTLILTRRGRLRAGGLLLVVGIGAALTYTAVFVSGGILSPSMTVVFVVIILAGGMLGTRSVVLTTLLAIAMAAALVVLELIGRLPSSAEGIPPEAYGMVYGTMFAVAGGVTLLTMGQLRGAVVRARASAEAQEEANDRLTKTANELRRRNLLLASLQDTAVALLDRHELPALLETIVTRAAHLCDTEHGYLYLRQPDETIVMRIGTGLFADHVGYTKAVGVGMAGSVCESGDTLVVDNHDSWPGRTDDQYPPGAFHSAIALPLIVEKDVVGAIGIAFGEKDRVFTADTIEHMSRFAKIAALALDNAQLYDSMRQELAERVRAEETLRKHELAMEASIDGMAIVEDGVVTYANESCVRLHGVDSADELLGRRWQDLFKETVGESSPRTLETALARGRHWRDEINVLAPDGDQRVLERTLTAIGPNAWVAVVRDLTEQRHADLAMRQAQKLESLGLLAGGIAHDFNSYLTGILGHASLGDRALQSGNDVGPALNAISDAAKQAAELTQQLLAYAGHGHFEVETLDLGVVIAETRTLAGTLCPPYAELVIDQSPETLPIEADRGQIRQLIMNLVLNGIEALGGQQGTVTVTTGLHEIQPGQDNPVCQVERRTIPAGEYAVLEVSDTGRGIEDQLLERLFDPFFSTKGTGRGLGLATARGVIQSCGGYVQVVSHPGVRTTFRVLFPVSDHAVSTTPFVGPSPEPTLIRHAGTALVIDDEELVRAVAGAMLVSLGFNVLTASEGREGLERYAMHPDEISVAILDLQMPGMSGRELFETLRARGSTLPIIVSSGYAADALTGAMLADTRTTFLQKPYDLGELSAAIHEVKRRESAASASPPGRSR